MKLSGSSKFVLLCFTLSLIGLTNANAQEDEVNEFVKKQFYGNRIKGGSLLFSAGFQRTDIFVEDVEGITGEIGIGVTVGLTEHFGVTASYTRNRANQLSGSADFSSLTNLATAHNFAIGGVYLFNTLGGFIQPYGKAEFLISEVNFRDSKDEDPFRIQTFGGGEITAGLTFWVSTFMSISFEPLNFTLTGNLGDDQDFDGELNTELALLNPTVRISFLVNGKKPKD
ncbi:MAG: hypothetical protein AAGC47_09570 [Bacteroidota bacterium]